MSSGFDAYNTTYEAVVQDSIAFSGLKHDFFLEAKGVELERLFARHFGSHCPTMLDVGCGVGRMHPMMSRSVSTLAGCDPSGDSIARARDDNPTVSYRQSEGSTLPWETASFDVTLAVCVFHHVPLAERVSLLAEMQRVTKSGGLTVIIEHNPLNPLTRLAVARCPFDHDAVLLSAGETKRLLESGGYSKARADFFLLLPSRHKLAGWLESKTAALPLGAQYIASGVR
jgi:ubiquinone/menaquinone biosynthesis C-methylase UbiE